MITEDRFKNMTTIQWLFHYLEICKYEQRDIEMDINKIKTANRDIHRDLKFLMLVTEPERGKSAVDTIEDYEKREYEMQNNPNKVTEEKPSDISDRGEKALSSDDQELWDFMMTTPETKALPEQARQVRDYVVEAKSLADVAEDLGFIGMNDISEVKEIDDISTETINSDIQEIKRAPMVIQTINQEEANEITLGFELE